MDRIALSPFNPQLELGEVQVYDSTLRDGEQMPGIAFSLEQKVAIARKLDEVRVPQIEAGFPAVSEGEKRSIRAISKLNLDAEILALSRVVKGDIDAAVDAGVDMVLLFVATSDIHLRYKFNKPREYVLEKVVESLDYCRSRGVRAALSCEDSTRTELDFLFRVYQAAEGAGAERLGITDTVGCASPEAIEMMVRETRKRFRTPLSVHLHNDYGLALANAIAGVKAGAVAVATTVNGIGERAGNVPLEEFVATMKFVYGKELGVDASRLKELCELVASYSKVPLGRNHPLVGDNVFAHESGIHVAAVLSCPLTYESIPPEMVGNKRHLLLGKHSGAHYIRKRLEELGVSATEEQVSTILAKVKALGEVKGRVSDTDFEDLVKEVLHPEEHFKA
ncbi:MAG: homocitrate synthase family protein [Methanomassiliicoccales archaeon]|jgi:methanogen homocitrate synthase|nr:homocitrate synthase family protein [Methanomassiliicoccales archaeon]